MSKYEEIQKALETEDFATMTKIQEQFKKVSEEYSRRQSEAMEKLAYSFFENMIAGVAYKLNIPKDRIEEFQKYAGKKLLENIDHRFGTSLKDNVEMIKLLEEFAKTWMYSKDFDEIVQGPE
jgi:hypothetical protein